MPGRKTAVDEREKEKLFKVAVRPKKVSDFCSLITFYG